MRPYMHPKVPVVFEYLKRCSHQKRVATYSELGNHVGLAAQGTAMPLHYIQDACLALQLPPNHRTCSAKVRWTAEHWVQEWQK